MRRIFIDCEGRWPEFRYLDSVQSALVEGFVSAGVPGDFLVGHSALNWTFAVIGPIRKGGLRKISKILVSSASDRISTAFDKLDSSKIRKTMCNGDIINLESAQIRQAHNTPVIGTREVCIWFASRFALIQKKTGRTKTEYIRSPTETDFAAALKASLDRRAGRNLSIEIGIDSLTLATEGQSVPVALRRSGECRILIPTFNMPVTLRGNPEDVAWSFFAGLGAKTRQGFGCPILTG